MERLSSRRSFRIRRLQRRDGTRATVVGRPIDDELAAVKDGWRRIARWGMNQVAESHRTWLRRGG
jgi:hypothetical protein